MHTINRLPNDFLPFDNVNSDLIDLIIVAGAARTGTTLLQGILCDLEDSNELLDECAPIRFIVESYVKSKAYVEKYPDTYFRDVEDARLHFSRSLGEAIDAMKIRFGVKKLVLKEPALSQYINALLELLGQRCIVLCLVRDPRDTIGSYIVWGERVAERGGNHWFMSRDCLHLSKYYMGFYHFFSEDEWVSKSGQVFFIKYEELVSNSQSVFSAIGEVTGLAFDKNTGKRKWSTGKFDLSKQGPHKDAYSELYLQPISEAKVGFFPNILERAEIEKIEAYCLKMFDMFNYDVDTESSKSKIKPISFSSTFDSLTHSKVYRHLSDTLMSASGKFENKPEDIISLLKDTIPQLRRKVDELEKVEENNKELRKLNRTLLRDSNNLKKVKSEMVPLRKKSRTFDKLQPDLPKLKSDAKKYRDIEHELPKLKSEAKKFNEIEGELASMKYKVSEFDRLQSELPALKSDAKKYRDIEHELAELKYKSLAFEKLESELPKLKSEAKKFKEIEGELASMKYKVSEFDRLQSELPALKSDAKKYHDIAGDLAGLKYKAKQFEIVSTELIELRFKNKQLRILATKLADFSPDIDKYRTIFSQILSVLETDGTGLTANEISEFKKYVEAIQNLQNLSNKL